MDKQRICKICNRRFANGKAMGGHMRSHLAKLPVAAKPDTPVVESASPGFPSSSSSLSLQSNKDLMQTATLTHNRSESDTESPRSNPTKRRSERRRRAAVVMMEVVSTLPAPSPTMVVPEPVSVSSVTQNFSVEEVALCLLKLSKDKWPSKGKQVVEYLEEEDDDEEENEDVDEDEKEEEEEEDGLFGVTGGGATGGFKTNRKRFECGKCNKCFPSYQSLGGHKASHKKINYVHLNSGFEEESPTTAIGVGGAASSSQQKIQKNFECPFCDKVFESGQALGGHKKVHFSFLSVSPKPPAKSTENFTIDLNQPAPGEDSEVSVV